MKIKTLIFFNLIFVCYGNISKAQILNSIVENQSAIIKLGEIRSEVLIDNNGKTEINENQKKEKNKLYKVIRGAYDFKDLQNVLKKFDTVGINFTSVETYFNTYDELKDVELDYRIYLALYNYSLAEGDRYPYNESVCLKKYYFGRRFLQLAIKNLYKANSFYRNFGECYELIDFSTFEFNNDFTRASCNKAIPNDLRVEVLKQDLENIGLLKKEYIKSVNQKLSSLNTELKILFQLFEIDTTSDYNNKIIATYSSIIDLNPGYYIDPYIKRADFKQYNLKLYSSAISDYLKGIAIKKSKFPYNEFYGIGDCYYNLKDFNNAIIYYTKSYQAIDNLIKIDKDIISGRVQNTNKASFSSLQSKIEMLLKTKSEIYFYLGISYYQAKKLNQACLIIEKAIDLGYDSKECLNLMQNIGCK